MYGDPISNNRQPLWSLPILLGATIPSWTFKGLRDKWFLITRNEFAVLTSPALDRCT